MFRSGSLSPSEGLSTPNSYTSENSPLLSSSSSSETLRRLENGTARTDCDQDRPRRNSVVHNEDDNENLPEVSRLRAVCIAFNVWILLFLQASNMSGMTMAQSTVAHDLKSYESAMWFTTAYLIAASSLSPLLGRLATIFPPRSLVPASSALLALGSLACSRARTFTEFVAGRALMGAGSAGIMTLAVVLVLGLVGKKRRGTFIGLINVGFTIGLSFGAVVFGAVEPVVGWRALFWIQAPISAMAGLMVYLSLPASVGVNERSKTGSLWQKLASIDYLGAALLTFTIVLFLYGLAGDIQLGPLLLSAMSLALFLVFEYFVASDPIIPLKVLSSRGILLSCLAQLGFMSARWTLLYYAPVFMLAVRGYSPAAAGSILIPTNFGFGSGGLLAGLLHIRRGGSFWLPSVLSFACFAATLYVLSLVGSTEVSAWAMSLAVFANGLSTGAALNYTLAHILHLSHEGTSFITTSLMGTVRGFGGSFGTAIGGGVFYRVLKAALEQGYSDLEDGGPGGGLSRERAELVRKLLGSPAYVFGGDMSVEEKGVAIGGYAVASKTTWAAAAGLGILVLLVQMGTGRTSPEEEKKPARDEEREEGQDEEEEARAALLEREGVGEA